MSKYQELKQQAIPYWDGILYTSDMVSDLIKMLKCYSSPGYDGITSEHLYFSESNDLLERFVLLYSTIINYGLLQNVFKMEIIMPVLMKQL